MPHFSSHSLQRLATCDSRLVGVFNTVIQHVDCTVLCGHRNRQQQEEAFSKGTTRLHWPASKHNHVPSQAVDVAPFPIDWQNMHRFYFFAGYVLGTAKQMGIDLRSGLDWDQDFQTSDQILIDGPHFELVNGGE